MLIGVAIFLVGDRIVEKRFSDTGAGAAMGIVVGSVVDGVPESVIFGVQLATGFPLSIGFLAAVLVSNVPQAMAPSAELAAAGWTPRRLGQLWLLVIVACGVAAALGYLAADASGAVSGERMAALAAGGLLAMLTNSLIPFAYERGASGPGVGTVVGFCIADVDVGIGSQPGAGEKGTPRRDGTSMDVRLSSGGFSDEMTAGQPVLTMRSMMLSVGKSSWTYGEFLTCRPCPRSRRSPSSGCVRVSSDSSAIWPDRCRCARRTPASSWPG